MGVFNSINFTCPECGEVVEVQSKAEYGCRQFSSEEVPPVFAQDIEGQTAWCERGHGPFTVTRKTNPNILMKLV